MHGRKKPLGEEEEVTTADVTAAAVASASPTTVVKAVLPMPPTPAQCTWRPFYGGWKNDEQGTKDVRMTRNFIVRKRNVAVWKMNFEWSDNSNEQRTWQRAFVMRQLSY